MTEKLKTLMDESADLPFAAPDLDAIVKAGDRSVLKRRALGGVTVVAVAVLAVTGVALVRSGGGDQHLVAGDPAPLHGLTWATDGALHTPSGASFQVGHPIAAYVRTSVGYVFTDGDGSVFAYVGGEVTQIGRIDTSHPRLVADDEGTLAGWVDPSGDEPTFVAYDLATGAQTRFGEPGPGMGQLADEADPFYFYAIDGRDAYVRDSRGAVEVDVDTGDVRVVDRAARNGFSIGGAENGLVVFPVEGGVDLGPSPDRVQVHIDGPFGGSATFSPDGHWVSFDADEPEVYDATTGEKVAMHVDGRPFATGFEWLDDHTLVMAASEQMVGPLQLLTCTVPAGTCEVTVPDLGNFDDIEGKLAVANGITTD